MDEQQKQDAAPSSTEPAAATGIPDHTIPADVSAADFYAANPHLGMQEAGTAAAGESVIAGAAQSPESPSSSEQPVAEEASPSSPQSAASVESASAGDPGNAPAVAEASATAPATAEGEVGNVVAVADGGGQKAGDAPAGGGDEGNVDGATAAPSAPAPISMDASSSPVVPSDSIQTSDPDKAGDVPNAIASTAAAQSESAAASSAPLASLDAGTVASPASATTGSELVPAPHPAEAHLNELEYMLERLIYRGEQFAIEEWKGVINAARAVL